ncbi:MAG: hypothetical protein ACREK2_07765 [Gemmatimonadota bacterium]
MMEKDNNQNPEGYEPPEVEEVLRAEDLEREVHYAGAPISTGGVG